MKECELVIAGGGLTAARAVTSYREAGGYSINVTLIFSLTRHRQIANVKVAYQQYKELFSGASWDALAARASVNAARTAA